MGYEVRKRDERTQGSINNSGAEMRVKDDYTVILGVRVRRKEVGGSTKIWQ